MERFHINGSRVLSRSFQVEDWDPEANSDENDGSDHGSSANDGEQETATNDNEAEETGHNIDVEGDVDESDDEDQVKVEHVAMVPMADILNARYGSENVCLPPVCILRDYS
jgi:SET domain-containing protein 6